MSDARSGPDRQDSSLESVCSDCGRPFSIHADERTPKRCSECFEGFLRKRDADFLQSYAELGVSSRRVVAETCFRALALDSPPHRKVLAMTIMEQYVQSASDLIGLHRALKERDREPVMRSFLAFRLDRNVALDFFQEVARSADDEWMRGLGLPAPGQVARLCPSLSKSDVKDLERAIAELLANVRHTANMGEGAALALAQMAGESRAGAALTKQSAWLDDVGLRADQVAVIALDERRRTINITAISVDEKRLSNIISAIDAMTRASQNLIYAALSVHQEGQRAKQRRARAPRAKARSARA